MVDGSEWVLVPREPTRDMWVDGWNWVEPDGTPEIMMRRAWEAMLAAAPSIPVQDAPDTQMTRRNGEVFDFTDEKMLKWLRQVSPVLVSEYMTEAMDAVIKRFEFLSNYHLANQK